MSLWQEEHIEEKVLAILADVEYREPDHHLGRPFVTAYQLAIELATRHPDTVRRIGLPIGGRGTGQHSSLSWYLARQLSGKLRGGELPQVEGGFLSNLHLRHLAFTDRGWPLESSLTGSQYDVSIYRIRG
jgi:hypothetical protein